VRTRIAGIASGIGREVMALSTVKYGPLLLALLLVASPVRAQLGHNWTICINGNGTFAPEEAIGACTDLIKTSNGRPSSLYAALTNRGSSFYEKRQYDRAIADHTAAIKLNLKDSTAYNNRGNAYKAMGATALSQTSTRLSASIPGAPSPISTAPSRTPCGASSIGRSWISTMRSDSVRRTRNISTCAG
jgi:hypothetical protein